METTAIDQATSPSTFSVLSFVQQTAYPEKQVTVHTHVAAAKTLVELNEKLNEATTSDEQKAIEADIAKCVEAIEASALTFSLRGFAPGIVQETLAKHGDDEDNTGDAELIAKSIIRVTASNGAIDEHLWEIDEVKTLRGSLAENEYVKLLGGVADVIFNAAVFDQATDAGFLGGRADVAAEL